MKKNIGCSCHCGLSRCEVLRGGFAAAVSSMGRVNAEPAVPAALKRSGIRAIDIHAHYYPQPYFDLFIAEGRRFNAEFRMTEQGFFFRTSSESDGPVLRQNAICIENGELIGLIWSCKV
jgi:hypothetical protein